MTRSRYPNTLSFDRLVGKFAPLFTDGALQSSYATKLKPLYYKLFASKWTIILLLLIGIARSIFFLLAYAPADGADATDYYLYAAYIAGRDLPSRAANVSPIYPIFIYINHYVLGHFNLILLWQLLMSSLLGVIMYLGLRRYNALLATVIAVVVLADAQIGILYNFVSTEPLYIFLLVTIFALAAANFPRCDEIMRWQDVVLGMLLFIIRETRTVARYLFVPVLLLFAIQTSNWKRFLITGVSCVFSAFLFQLAMNMAHVQQTSSYNNNMYARPLQQTSTLNPEDGPASNQLATLIQACKDTHPDMRLQSCLETELGEVNRVYDLYTQAYQETLASNPMIMLKRSAQAFHDFLLLSGKQYSGTSAMPADLQCADIDSRTQRQIDYLVQHEWESLTLSPAQQAEFEAVVHDFTSQMCPPWITNQTVTDITDYIAFRYRSLARPHPYIWNTLLILLIIVVPWARRYWYPVFLAGAIWTYHAAVSAAVLNVQPRYVVVTNPAKAVLVITLLFIIATFVVRAADTMLYQHELKGSSDYGKHTH